MTKENKDVEVNEESTNIDVEQTTNSTDESLKTEEQTDVDNQHIPYTRFKEKVDEANALKKKLAEIEKEQAEAKRKELEEQNEYKTLYEQALQQAEQAKQEALTTKKSAILTQSGYSAEQAELLVKLVEGSTDEEIAESIKLLQATIPAQDNYGDPSPFNGTKDKPETVDAEDIGISTFQQIKNKIFN